MKKALLLVVLFLGGMTTQTMAQNHHRTVKINKGKKHRYHNPQAVSFVENGVLFTVFTDGTFDFTQLHSAKPYRYGRKNYKTTYYGNSHRKGRNNHRRGYNRLHVKKDRYGDIIGINNICIGYKRNGKVNQIGSVPIYHQRGQLVQVGNMTIEYNRFGDIRNTYGSINRYNRKVWHDDWNTYNDHIEGRNTQVVWEGRKRINK